jgi:phosphatidate cytidylyltransferase
VQQRLIGAAVLVPVVVVVFLLGQPWLTLAIALLAGFAAYETARLVKLAGLDSDAWLAIPLAVVAVVAMWWMFTHTDSVGRSAIAGIGFVGLVAISAAVVSLRKEPHAGFKNWVGTMTATFYPSLLAFMAAITLVTVPLPTANWPVQIDAGRIWLLVLVLTVWSLDTFAFLAGKFIHRGRFMNHVSPNKTWSGAIGGFVAAVVTCGLLMVIIGQQLAYGLLLGALIGIVAQAGDLTESMLKRAAGEKDSGTLIPGHGGFLDRLDSFLFAAPVMFGFMFVVLGSYSRFLIGLGN